MTKSLKEALKEFARVMISGLVPVLSTLIMAIISGINTELGVISIKWNVLLSIGLVQVLTLIATALPKALDKYTFEESKLRGESKGIIPF